MIVGICAILGLIAGSLLTTIVHRVPRGLPVLEPRSTCPTCGGTVATSDAVPVLSWLALRGRCRRCGERISARYPLIELGTGLAFAFVALRLSSSVLDPSPAVVVAGILVIVAYLYFAAVAIALALIDIDVHRLPNAIVLPSYAVAVVLLVSAAVVGSDYPALVRSGLGMAVLGLAYFAMALAYPGGMGFGDVKLAGVVGLYLGWLGWGALAVGAFAAFLLGGLYAVGLLAARRADRRSGIPFGPWMLAGAGAGVFFGDAIAMEYLGLVGLT